MLIVACSHPRQLDYGPHENTSPASQTCEVQVQTTPRPLLVHCKQGGRVSLLKTLWSPGDPCPSSGDPGPLGRAYLVSPSDVAALLTPKLLATPATKRKRETEHERAVRQLAQAGIFVDPTARDRRTLDRDGLRSGRSARLGFARGDERVPAPGLWNDTCLGFNGPMAPAIHHTVLVVSHLDTSLKFYVDGIGLEVLRDREVEGDWPTLFGAESTTLRVIFLGNANVPDDTAGVLELNVFPGDRPAGGPVSPPPAGLFMISYFVDVEATLARLEKLGLARDVRRVSQPTPNGSVVLATVRDPDGVAVLLTPGSITAPSAAR